MPILEIFGEPFNVRLDGPEDAPALVLSNSLSSDLTMWEAQVAEWCKHFRVLRYDQRGHGRSVVSEGPYSIERLAQDALAIMNHVGIAKAHWCGLSMGGMVGMWILTHARQRIDRAVLANTAAHMGPPELWNGRIRTASKGGMEALVDATIQRWFTRRFIDTAHDEIVRMRAMILATPVAGYKACCSAIRDMDQREAIRSVTNPTLVIVGEHDPATTPEAGRLIHEAIRGSKLVTLDAAHIGNMEQPQAFTEAVLEFLRA